LPARSAAEAVDPAGVLAVARGGWAPPLPRSAGSRQGAVMEIFTPIETCWVCGARERGPLGVARFDLTAFHGQHPDLARYTGKTVGLVACGRCGFGQPEA